MWWLHLSGTGYEGTRFGGGVGRLARGLKDKSHPEKGTEQSRLSPSLGTPFK